MNKKRLFEYVKTQNQSKLLELLSLAFDTMDTNQRHDVFGKTAKEVPPPPVDGKEILTTIEQFYEKSMAGYYYAPFDINSKNFSDIPEGTDAWFDEISDYLNGGFGIKMDIIQINLWNRRTSTIVSDVKGRAALVCA